jgi:hypothetical protein
LRPRKAVEYGKKPFFTGKCRFLREKSIVREKTRGTPRGLLYSQRDLIRERFEQMEAFRGDQEPRIGGVEAEDADDAP